MRCEFYEKYDDGGSNLYLRFYDDYFNLYTDIKCIDFSINSPENVDRIIEINKDELKGEMASEHEDSRC